MLSEQKTKRWRRRAPKNLWWKWRTKNGGPETQGNSTKPYGFAWLAAASILPECSFIKQLGQCIGWIQVPAFHCAVLMNKTCFSLDIKQEIRVASLMPFLKQKPAIYMNRSLILSASEQLPPKSIATMVSCTLAALYTAFAFSWLRLHFNSTQAVTLWAPKKSLWHHSKKWGLEYLGNNHKISLGWQEFKFDQLE